MEPPILTIPVEILSRIFETCEDFRQVVAFASTCSHNYVTWVRNSPIIIWSVGKSQIRSFDDALMAVRATAIVLKAYQAGNLPPAVAVISSLSGKSKVPDLAELKEVLNIQHLVRCIEYMYFYSSHSAEFTPYNPVDDLDMYYGKYPSTRRRFPEYLKENIPGAENATIDSFQDGFYRAMYRLLLAGAVLARAYVEPLFRARGEADPVTKNQFFIHWGSDEFWSEESDNLGDQLDYSQPKEAHLAYIRQSAVYNFDVPDWSEIGQWRNQEYEVCFGPFASWIIEDGRMRKQNEPQDATEIEPSWARNRADIGAVRELMLLLVAYDHFNDHFVQKGTRIPYMEKQGNRTVTIVRFGQFQVEKITMPAAVKDLSGTYLYSENHPALKGTEGEDIPLQFDMFVPSWRLPEKTRSPIPYHNEHPGPPLELELWNFALRHYLDLTFLSGTFWMPQLECIWWREVGRGDIFLNPNWAVVQKYKPGVISWDYRDRENWPFSRVSL